MTDDAMTNVQFGVGYAENLMVAVDTNAAAAVGRDRRLDSDRGHERARGRGRCPAVGEQWGRP